MFTQTTYDGVDYNEHRANVHLSPRGAHWKAFSACYFIPPLALSVHCIKHFHTLSVYHTNIRPGLTSIEQTAPIAPPIAMFTLSMQSVPKFWQELPITRDNCCQFSLRIQASVPSIGFLLRG